MTIFRLKNDQKPYVVKKLPDPEIQRMSKDWTEMFGEFKERISELEAAGRLVISFSRAFYQVVDKKLKDKKLSKEDKAELLSLRKRSYDLTVSLKKLGVS